MKRLLVAFVAVVALAVPAAAVADSCHNDSRAPAACGWDCQGPVIDGNWVWLPSIGVPEYTWGFAPPGAEDSTLLGLPGANGNYTNGQTSSLLGMSAVCTGNGNASNARQTTNGAQTGCE